MSINRISNYNIKYSNPPSNVILDLINYYELKQYDIVERKALSITKEFPKYQLSWKVLAAVFTKKNKNHEALHANKEALKLNPKDEEVLNNLGLILQKLGKLKEAENNLKKAISLKPNFSQAYFNLGITQKGLGMLEEAEISYNTALQFQPNYAQAFNNLGNLLKETGRLEEAEANYTKALTLNPNYAEAHNNLGFTLQKLGKLEEAEVSYTKALTMKPDYAEALYNRGYLFFNKARYEEALMDADACISKEAILLSLISLHALGRIDEIYKRIAIQSKINKDDISIAAFSSFISEKVKKPTAYNFCPNPIEFINISNLSAHVNDSSSYIARVIDELKNIKTIWEPYGKATVNGFQSLDGKNLFKSSSENITQLKSIIITELEKYFLKFKNKNCSYIKRFPPLKNILGWHVVLKSTGYQSPHIHPVGWVSGVIYLKVVPSLGKDEGAIEFSLNGKDYYDVNSPALKIQPEEGDIVLFPSSLHHKTIPFSSDADRIIISFDLNPPDQVITL